ncbi:Kinesin-like protein KIN-8A, partial [Armadillidium vulgare]
AEVYSETTKRLIPFVLEGFNATVFAYGPTGTGKTYTMVGTPNQPGIMVMALNDLFTLMMQGHEKFQVMSYLEIYNDTSRPSCAKF